MLAYKTISGTKSFKKLVHLGLQFLAFCLSIIGVWAALKFHNDKGIDNFYSLHSWLGLACLFLFGIQVTPYHFSLVYNYKVFIEKLVSTFALVERKTLFPLIWHSGLLDL